MDRSAVNIHDVLVTFITQRDGVGEMRVRGVGNRRWGKRGGVGGEGGGVSEKQKRPGEGSVLIHGLRHRSFWFSAVLKWTSKQILVEMITKQQFMLTSYHAPWISWGVTANGAWYMRYPPSSSSSAPQGFSGRKRKNVQQHQQQQKFRQRVSFHGSLTKNKTQRLSILLTPSYFKRDTGNENGKV